MYLHSLNSVRSAWPMIRAVVEAVTGARTRATVRTNDVEVLEMAKK